MILNSILCKHKRQFSKFKLYLSHFVTNSLSKTHHNTKIKQFVKYSIFHQQDAKEILCAACP